ncbi:hypothetical protein [Acidilobus sp.]|uniref:hypothetical protein n=1 Tax=Acidilobus sp. TaxID=1872109 RepID=UPI003CFF5170
MRSGRDRAIKEALLSQLKGKVPLDDVIEWLWDDFGLRAKRSWEDVGKVITSSNEILPQDVAVFMIEEGVTPDEGAWSVLPAPKGLRGGGNTKANNGG